MRDDSRATRTPSRDESARSDPSPVRSSVPSFGQQRLWFLEQLVPNTAAYNLAYRIDIRGRLDQRGLTRALRAIVRRQHALRTTLGAVGPELVQRVWPTPASVLQIVDLRSNVGADSSQLTRAIERLAVQPFRLDRELPFRFTLLQRGELDHVLVLVFHHVAFDGPSLRIFLREVEAAYAATLDDDRVSTDPVVQYVDFAQWERERLVRGALQEQLSYWRGRLLPPPAALALPRDRPAQTTPSFRGGSVAFRCSASCAEKLRRLAAQEHASLFMALVAGFCATLHGYSGQDDLVIGSPVDRRADTAFEDLIGFFTNTVALRIDLGGDPSYRALLRRTRDAVLDALTNQDLPFEKVVAELRLDPHAARSPLVQATIAFDASYDCHLTLPNVSVDVGEIGIPAVKFDLTCVLQSVGPELTGVIEYAGDTFDEATAALISQHYAGVLGAAVARPDGAIASLTREAGVVRRAAPPPPVAVALVTPADSASTLSGGLRDTEATIARLWSDALGEPPASPREDFFEVGGDSFAALRLVTAIRETFEVDLPLAELYEAASVAGLARRVGGLVATRISATAQGVPAAVTLRLKGVPWFTQFLVPGETPIACAAACCRSVVAYVDGDRRLTTEAIHAQALRHARTSAANQGIDPAALATLLTALDTSGAYHYYRFADRRDATVAAARWLASVRKPVIAYTLAGQHTVLLTGFVRNGARDDGTSFPLDAVVVVDPARGDMRPETAGRRPDKPRSYEYQTGRTVSLREWYGDEWWMAHAWWVWTTDSRVSADRTDGAYPLPHWTNHHIIVVDDSDRSHPPDREGRLAAPPLP